MKFRPCIDLHSGEVKQIVGSTLKDNGDENDAGETNFSTSEPGETGLRGRNEVKRIG